MFSNFQTRPLYEEKAQIGVSRILSALCPMRTLNKIWDCNYIMSGLWRINSTAILCGWQSGRLRLTVDQVHKTRWFESISTH